MARVETVLREEIVRLSRKVTRQMQARIGEEVRRLKTRVASLQQEVTSLKHARAEELTAQRMMQAKNAVPVEEAEKIRVTPVLLKKLRKRLDISQPQMGQLLGVSNAAVGFWESGKAMPRPELRVKIAALRRLGRRDVRRLLAQVEKRPAKAARRAAPAKGRRGRKAKA